MGRTAKFMLTAFMGAALLFHAAEAETVRIDAAALPALGKLDPRFQSYNVEMAEVIGGRFWKPYQHMTPNGPSTATSVEVGRDPGLFEKRAPADLSNKRLRALAAALGPAYIRVSGSWANSAHFQNDDLPAAATPPAGFQNVLTRAQWRGVIDFAKAADAKLVTSFAIGDPVRDQNGLWTPVEAKPLLDYTRAIGGEIYAAELFNEPNLACHSGDLKTYSAANFARDIAAFRTFLAATAPTIKVVGPGDAMTANQEIPGAPTSEALLTAEPRPRFDVFSYHFYGAVSERCSRMPPMPSPCGPTRDPKTVATSKDQALTEEWLSRTDLTFDNHKTLRDRYAPAKPIWITETAQAACGGSPWAATYLDTFRYLDQMGRLAKRNPDVVIFHNTLAASEYGLIEQFTFDPRPNYWAALLWHRLMGDVVLDSGASKAGFHVYAQCQRGHKGGVMVLAINTDEAASTVDVSGPADVYAFTAPELESPQALLNGKPLTVGADNRLPKFKPVRARGPISVGPKSIIFIAQPGAANPKCM